jgi:thiamine-monophosphate kinase
MEALRFYDGQEIKEQMRAELGKPSRRVLANLGESGAVVAAPGGRLAVQTTLFIEDVHFDLSYTTPKELGHKALAGGLSALAALAAAPLYAVLAVGLKQDQGEIFVAELLSGAAALAKKWGVDLVGEASAPSPSGTTVSITVFGEARGKALTPRGAKPGDVLVLCGPVGTSAAGLSYLKRLGRPEAMKIPEAFRAHLLPEPKLAEARVLAELGLATAAVDLRDGLTRDLYRLTEASGVGCLLDEGNLPISPRLLQWERELSSDARAWALYGGEDYGLLFTVPAKHYAKVEQALRRKRLEAAPVGAIVPAREKVKLRTLTGEIIPLLPKVWSHFARRARPRSR